MSKPHCHIIHVIADAGPGGAPTHVVALLTGLKRTLPTAALSLIAPRGWITKAAQPQARVFPAELTSAISRTSHRAFRRALDAALAAHPDVPTLVHFHGVRAGSLGYLATRYRGRRPVPPLIYTEHLWTRDYHLKNRLRELLQLRLLGSIGHRFARIIAVSDAVSTFLLERKLAAPERLVVIPNGIAMPSDSQTTRQPDNRLRIGAIGSLVPLKGFDILLHALPSVLQKHPETSLVIIGHGSELDTLTKLAEKLHVARAVRWLTKPTDLGTEFAQWDLSVSTSRSESFGLAIGEAMAAGLPVVATTVGGIPELVTKETGRLVPPGDPAMLATAINDLLAQPKLRARLGAAGRKRIQDHFNVETMVTATAKVYEQVLDERTYERKN